MGKSRPAVGEAKAFRDLQPKFPLLVQMRKVWALGAKNLRRKKRDFTTPNNP